MKGRPVAQLSLFDQPAPPAAPKVAPAPPAAPAPVASAGLGSLARPGDWVRIDPRRSKMAEYPGKDAGLVVDVVAGKPYPVQGLLLHYGQRGATPRERTIVLGGFDSPHPFESVAELWRMSSAGDWQQLGANA